MEKKHEKQPVKFMYAFLRSPLFLGFGCLTKTIFLYNETFPVFVVSESYKLCKYETIYKKEKLD